jgi:hypothetical protein
MLLSLIQVNVLQKLCGQMGDKQSSRLTKHEAVEYHRKNLNVPEHFKEIYSRRYGVHQVNYSFEAP